MSNPFLEATRELKNAMVLHTDFANVLDGAQKIIDYVAETRISSGFILTAESGMGKSALLDVLERRVTKKLSTYDNHKCVIRLDLDAFCDTFKLATATSTALGYPPPPARTNLDTVTRMVDSAIASRQVRTILVDEGQHICEGNRDISARASFDWFKRRIDINPVLLAMTGTHTLKRLREINPQLSSRIPANFSLNSFDYGDAWNNLLIGISDAVKAVDFSIVKEKKLAKYLHNGCEGRLRPLKIWLTYSVISKKDLASTKMTIEDLNAGYEAAFGSEPDINNPFK